MIQRNTEMGGVAGADTETRPEGLTHASLRTKRGAERSENRECLQTPRTDEKHECKDRNSNPPRESQGENPQPDTLQENASGQAEQPGRSQRRGSGDSGLSAGSRGQDTGRHPRTVAAEQLAPSPASLAKPAFKEEEKSGACLQKNKTRVYYYRPILKEL